MITEEEAIKRAKHFLNTQIDCIELEHNWFEGYSTHKFENADKPYYVYTNSQTYGCFESNSEFFSKENVNWLINRQLGSNHLWHYDHVIIFDIEKNKVIKPGI